MAGTWNVSSAAIINNLLPLMSTAPAPIFTDQGSLMKNKTRYLRRKAKEKANKRERQERQKEIDRRWAKVHEENRQRQKLMEDARRQWQVLEQRLVNILAKRLCQLSPEYEKQLRGKQTVQSLLSIVNFLGGSSMFGVHTISEEPFMAIEDKK